MFLPVNRHDLEERGIDRPDFVYVSGDAYVDHPSFGHAVITRMIEARGYTVGVIAQPLKDEDYCALGEPKRAFLVGSGVVDSMVNNYSVARRRRTRDVYSEGGRAGRRPDRALTVYCHALKRLFPGVCVIAGGIEASLRRLSHYDYWADRVMHSVLADSGADLLMYGMGERPLTDLLDFCDRNVPLGKVRSVRGTAYLTDPTHASRDVADAIARGGNDRYLVLPSHEQTATDKIAYCRAFVAATENTDPVTGKGLLQQQDATHWVVQNPPQLPLSEAELDAVYALPYERRPHPMYADGVPAIEEVAFSVTSHRGCFGNCAFCALTYHQGRRVQHRSRESVVAEAERLTHDPAFKGYIHDVGGPSANFRNPSCEAQKKAGMCKNRECIGTHPCRNLVVDHSDYLSILRSVRALPGVKKVFVRSGVRFDYVLLDPDPSFFRELVRHHVSGQLKVAPEHVSDRVLARMNKPPHAVYERFCKLFREETARAGLDQYLVPYFISSHPGCTLDDAIELAEYLHGIGYRPQQVQDFYPTPSTLATTMYWTGLDPRTLEPVYVARTPREKAMQRALLQYSLKSNRALVREALVEAGRTDLIGFGKRCLLRPEPSDAARAGGKKSASAVGKKPAADKRSGRAPHARPHTQKRGGPRR